MTELDVEASALASVASRRKKKKKKSTTLSLTTPFSHEKTMVEV